MTMLTDLQTWHYFLCAACVGPMTIVLVWFLVWLRPFSRALEGKTYREQMESDALNRLDSRDREAFHRRMRQVERFKKDLRRK